MKFLKKLFGGLELTWPKLIVFAVAAGVYTAVMAIIPALHYTSFSAITVTLEAWIFFGILIIMNSRSNLDAGLKCFVFFLISQPLVYLLQVPFSWQGWGLFQYYKFWFVWTLFCFPMGFVGYYMKQGKWWGYLILLPMILLTGYCYYSYFPDFLFYCPKYILVSLFCAGAMLLYPVAIFDDRRIRLTGLIVSGVLIVALTVLCLLHPPVYSTQVLASGEALQFDDSYTVSLEDPGCGEVRIIRPEGLDDYMVQADFRKAGTTALILESPEGEQTVFDLRIEKDTYRIEKREGAQ